MNRPCSRYRSLSTALWLVALSSVVVAQRDPIHRPYLIPSTSPTGAVRPKSPANAGTDALLKELLSRPAPPPQLNQKQTRERPPEFYDEANAPSEDASTDDLLTYWQKVSNSGGPDGPKITETIRERLLEACEHDPLPLTSLLDCLPDNPTTADRIKRIYDAAATNPDVDDDWRSRIRGWLRLNSTYYLGDLIRLANKAKDSEGGIENEDQLNALAKVDREAALPILRALAHQGEPRTSVLALSWLYRYAVADKDSGNAELYRPQLMQIGADQSAKPIARNAAIEALSETDWIGQDDWYESLFTDESLIEASDGSAPLNPLTILFKRDPDRWIPVLAEWTKSKTRAIRRNAANCLMQYAREHPRREALLPLLRGLTEPEWFDLPQTSRFYLIRTLETTKVPECVPALISLLQQDDGNRRLAAHALISYPDARAIPALKRALIAEKYSEMRQDTIEALSVSGGLSDAEAAAGIEAYAIDAQEVPTANSVVRETVTASGLIVDGRFIPAEVPIPISIGSFFARQSEVPDGVANLIFARIVQLERTNPALAGELLTIAQTWKGKRADLDLVQRIAAGTAGSAAITSGLDRREVVAENARILLQATAARAGAGAGVAAVLLYDADQAGRILAGSDRSAQTALLACARLVQMTLPADRVGTLLKGGSPLLNQAAEKYLLAADSAEARHVLWAHFPQQGYITGWRDRVPSETNTDLTAIEKTEARLQREITGGYGSPEQIFALIETGEFPYDVVRVYPDRVTLTNYENVSRYRDRIVDRAQVEEFRRLMAEASLTESGPRIEDCGYDCRVNEFLALSRGGGRRLLVAGYGSNYDRIRALFTQAWVGPRKTHYLAEAEIGGMRVLVDEPELNVRDIVQEGGVYHLRVERDPTAEERELNRQEEKQRATAEEEQADDTEDLEAAIKLRRAERERERIGWHEFADGRLSSERSWPQLAGSLDTTRFVTDSGFYPAALNNRLAYAKFGGGVILVGGYEHEGLWLLTADGSPSRIGEENYYSSPVVTPDGKWIVAARTETHWGNPNGVVRVELSTGRIFPVDLPFANQFEPVAYLAGSGQILLRRARDEEDAKDDLEAGPATPEFYLLDASTGKTRLIKGSFEALLASGPKLLQPTGKPNEVWAALPDEDKNETRVVRYHLNEFSVQAVMTLPKLTFKSEDMWVDEAKGQIYIVYEGQLISVPLAGGSK